MAWSKIEKFKTPVHRAIFDPNDKNVQPDESYENVSGIFFDEYLKAIKEAGNVWAVPVIDLNATSGLFPLYDQERSSIMMPRKTACILTMPVMRAWRRPSCTSSPPCLATFSQEASDIEKCNFSA